MTQSTTGLVEKLRERDAQWQKKADGWIAEAGRIGGEVTAENEATIRHTWEAEAADLLSTQETTIAELVAALEGTLRSLEWWRKNEPASFGNIEQMRVEAAETALTKSRSAL